MCIHCKLADLLRIKFGKQVPGQQQAVAVPGHLIIRPADPHIFQQTVRGLPFGPEQVVLLPVLTQ